MKFQSLNNATTIITSGKDKIILDPWVVGHLYQNSWSAFPKTNFDNDEFKSITHVIITHFHADHFDPETLKLINKKAKIILPDFKFNYIMMNTLKKLNFQNIEFFSLEKWHEISEAFSLYIIPPLNSMAQELHLYKESDNTIAIDTGIILKDKISETSHILLADNSPYDFEAFKKHVGEDKYSSFWFPYNGYAGDYPLCYDNLNINEKKEISKQMNINRESSNLKVINYLKPDFLFPYSSDFALNGPYKDIFFDVHDEQFFHKYKYAARIEKISNIKALALYANDTITFYKDKEPQINILSTEKDKNSYSENKKLIFPEVNYTENFLDELNNALTCMFERINKYKLNTKGMFDWNLHIKTENELFKVDLLEKKVSLLEGSKSDNKKILLLKTSEKIVRSLLQKKIHFDNAQIGCYLSWERRPNEFNKALYDSLCFFHLS